MTIITSSVVPKLDEWLRKIDPNSLETIPVSLEEIGSVWGVNKVIKRPLDRPGLLYRMKDGRLIVVLNESEPLVRQRFTWAHELGHIVMAGHDSVGISCIKTGEIDQELEHYCNAIAAELLMPNELFTSFAAAAGWELTAVNNLAKQFQVSPESAAIRMNHLRDEPIVMSMWRTSTQPLVALNHHWILPNEAAKQLKPDMQREIHPDAITPIFEALHSSQLATGPCRLLVKKNNQKSASRMYKWVPTDALGIGHGKNRRVIGFHYLSRNY